eukprot:Skav207943  [mRNA]  locus=scaffold108:272844:276368:+ [translate_table: standard]
MFYCSFFEGLNKTILGYFGLPLLYMVPHDQGSKWVQDFIALAALPTSLFVSNNPLHAEQVVWQSGVRLPVLRPVTLYISERYQPERPDDILVPEPREACVLYCLLRSFTPAGYPLKFFAKSDTDRTYNAFVRFRSVVLYPHDFALMTFYELPGEGVMLLGQWTEIGFPQDSRDGGDGFSPLSLTSSAALRHWRSSIDFFTLPGRQWPVAMDGYGWLW